MNNLFPVGTETHTAEISGDWFNSATWGSQGVPGEGAIVRIPEGIEVNYDGQSNESLFVIRVDGQLNFRAENGGTTELYVDTLSGTPQSTITAHASDATDGTIDIKFAPFDIEAWKSNPSSGWNNQALGHYVDGSTIYRHDGQVLPSDGAGVYGRFSQNGGDYSFDPSQITLGFITEGSVSIEGQDKTDFVKLRGNARIGDTTLRLSQVPDGWRVGDQINLTGTTFSNYLGPAQSDTGSRDEIFTITAINGDDVSLDKPLRFNHVGHAQYDYHAYVGNLTRNISFESESPDTITQRGHVMFMHNPDVDVRHAAFLELGRTDKSNLVDDLAFELEELNNGDWILKNLDGSIGVDGTLAKPEQIENQRGRYSVHFHKTGTHQGAQQTNAIGNVVWGSPGWGMVHHAGNALMQDNVIFMADGAGMVAESGSEIGAWIDNLSSSNQTSAASFRHEYDNSEFDVFDGQLRRLTRNIIEDRFRQGEAYGLSSRGVEMVGNVAATSFHGISLQGLGGNANPNLAGSLVEGLDPDLVEEAAGFDAFPLNRDINDTVNRGGAQLFRFEDNEIIATAGFAFKSQQRDDVSGIEVVSKLTDTTTWNNDSLLYISHGNHNYTLENFHSVNDREATSLRFNTSDITFVDSTFENVLRIAPTQGGNNDYRNQAFNFVNTTFVDRNGAQISTNFFSNRGGIVNDLPQRPPVVPLTFNPNNQLDTTINLNSDDFQVVIDGTITDSLGNDQFGHNNGINPSATSPALTRNRTYDFTNKLDEYIDEFGIFRDANGDYITLTEYMSDRVTGDTFPIEFRVDVIGWAGDPVLSINGGELTVNMSGANIFPSVLAQRNGNQIEIHSGGRVINSYPASSITSLRYLGGSGDDTFINATDLDSIQTGAGGRDILVGGGGSDTLTGGGGKDLLIGGDGTDTLQGSNGTDLLIGDRTAHDSSPLVLDTIMDSYQGDQGSFHELVHGTRGIRLNYAGTATIFSDGSPDTLQGNGGTDAFFTSLGDSATDISGDEFEHSTQNVVVNPDVTDLTTLWEFEGNANDAAPFGSVNDNLALVNAALTNDAERGNVLSLNGPGTSANVSNSVEINNQSIDNYTISLWFKADSTNGRQVLYEQGGKSRGFVIYIDDGSLYVNGYANGQQSVAISGGIANDSAWHHVALTLDTFGAGLTGYLDGASMGSVQRGTVGPHTGAIGVGMVRGKTLFHDGTTEGDYHFSGQMDDVRIYNRTLSAIEIQLLYDQT